MQAANWEIASHGYRWIDYQFIDEATERRHLREALEIHTRITGQRPSGWYLGRCSPQSHRIAAQEGEFIYNSDTYADDLPYWDYSFDTPQLMVPYTLDANDMRFATPQGFNAGRQFFDYLQDSFDVLHAEGGRMMSVGLHCRLAGRPGRTAARGRDFWTTSCHTRMRGLLPGSTLRITGVSVIHPKAVAPLETSNEQR